MKNKIGIFFELNYNAHNGPPKTKLPKGTEVIRKGYNECRACMFYKIRHVDLEEVESGLIAIRYIIKDNKWVPFT